MSMDDVDKLEGQALEDAFAREAHGWTLSPGGFYWMETEVNPWTGKTYLSKHHRRSWHPASQWGAFGFAVQDMCEMGFEVWLHTDGQRSECSVWAANTLGGKDPLVRQLGGKHLRETGLRAFIKAVRARRAAA
jgi:hypothetical protein